MTSFGQRNATPAAPAAPARSKYGGITASDTRDPMLGLGSYRVVIAACAEGYNPGKRRETYKVTVVVRDASEGADTPIGTSCTVVHFMTPAGLGELKRLAMAAAGYGPTLADRALGKINLKEAMKDAEEKFDSVDESFGYQGAILEASAGKANGAPTLVGRVVDVTVTRGKDVPNPQTGAPTGDFFRLYVWGTVPDDEQDAA